MKRTNLVLDEETLEEALRLSGKRTYSAAVDLALREFVRNARARRILELAGSGLWQGDLGEMRGDWAVSERKPRGRPVALNSGYSSCWRQKCAMRRH